MFPVPRTPIALSGVAASAISVGAIAWLAVGLMRAPSPPSGEVLPIAAAPAVSVAPPAAPVQPAPARPSFDVVRVAPSGETVVAGRAEPNSSVALLNRGVKIGEAKTDAAGQFVIMPTPLASGDHLLTLETAGPGGALPSEQSVAAMVPRVAGDKVVAALSAPGQPTTVLNDAGGKGEAPRPSVAIRSADAAEDGSFLGSGVAPPNASLRLYLNNSFVAAVQADARGAWSLKVGQGVRPGHYDIRADIVEPATGKVIARAEAPFDMPENKADPRPAVATAANVAPPPTPGVALVPEIQSVTVERGDSLWRISRRVLGRGVRYTQIYEANAAQIRDPNRIWPGQIFVAPK